MTYETNLSDERIQFQNSMQKVAKLALELVDNQSSSQAVLPKNLEEPSSKRQINLNDDYLNIHGQLEKLKQKVIEINPHFIEKIEEFRSQLVTTM